MLASDPVTPITDEQAKRIKKLGWQVVTRFVLSIAGAVGMKLGERAVEWIMGDEDESDKDPDDDDGDLSGGGR